MKDHLLTKWKKVYEDYRNNKKAKNGKKEKSALATEAAPQEETKEANESAQVDLRKPGEPYIPGGLKSYSTGVQERDNKIEKFIVKL